MSFFQMISAFPSEKEGMLVTAKPFARQVCPNLPPAFLFAQNIRVNYFSILRLNNACIPPSAWVWSQIAADLQYVLCVLIAGHESDLRALLCVPSRANLRKATNQSAGRECATRTRNHAHARAHTHRNVVAQRSKHDAHTHMHTRACAHTLLPCSIRMC